LTASAPGAFVPSRQFVRALAVAEVAERFIVAALALGIHEQVRKKVLAVQEP
jgi:hypothetical protein